MTVKIVETLTTESCNKCENSWRVPSFGGGATTHCTEKMHYNKFKKIPDPTTIPEWCELEDYNEGEKNEK